MASKTADVPGVRPSPVTAKVPEAPEKGLPGSCPQEPRGSRALASPSLQTVPLRCHRLSLSPRPVPRPARVPPPPCHTPPAMAFSRLHPIRAPAARHCSASGKVLHSPGNQAAGRRLKGSLLTALWRQVSVSPQVCDAPSDLAQIWPMASHLTPPAPAAAPTAVTSRARCAAHNLPSPPNVDAGWTQGYPLESLLDWRPPCRRALRGCRLGSQHPRWPTSALTPAGTRFKLLPTPQRLRVP